MTNSIRIKLGAALVVVAALLLAATSVSAWTFALSGKGECQPNGSFLITWTVDNSTENEAFTITQSSNTSVVAVGETVPAGQTEDFTQSAPGDKPGKFGLTLEGNWPSDQNERQRSAHVGLRVACEQPAPPEEPEVPETPKEQPKPKEEVPMPTVPDFGK